VKFDISFEVVSENPIIAAPEVPAEGEAEDEGDEPARKPRRARTTEKPASKTE
jgi:hypothetical protein